MGALVDAIFNGHLDTNAAAALSLFNLDARGDSDIQESVKILLQGLGEDTNREGLLKTPLRVAKALRQGTRGYRQNVKDIVQGALFPEAGLDGGIGHAGGAGGLVVVRDLDLFSYCESCLLPFRVKCHVGYVPSGQRVVGLSKLSRVADVYAKRLQDPQRLADQVCSSLQSGIRPAGVGVVLQCWHIHFPQVDGSSPSYNDRPTKLDLQGWSKVLVCAGSGVFENETENVWGDFLTLLKFRGVKVDKLHQRPHLTKCWCPSRSTDALTFTLKGAEPAPASMVAAVTAMLHSLGEDPSRKELVGTPRRFVQWLMNFKTSNTDMDLNGLCTRPLYGNQCSDQDELRSELNIPFCSQCEHHLLPFHGVVHIGYFHPKGTESLPRSILQSIVHFFGWKLQVQERLTRQIVETISSVFVGDVIAVVEANHICMISRGIEKVGSSTATIATMGRFSTDSCAKASFLQTASESTVSQGG